MGEIKSVKVDNWGVFFLQKLQNFFNKTDYCDLTLQFHDNSQLKVHRLVLSACTDYFNVLEHTCEVVDDALIMPNELQADVVVPIVNFMYTGTLEFELKMYGKLLRTAKEMNMTVLLKLLEAHRRTMEGVNRAQRPPSPKPVRRRAHQTATTGAPVAQHPQVQQQRRILTSANMPPPAQRRVAVQAKSVGTNAQSQQVSYRQQIGSTSLIRTSSGAGTITIKQEPQPQASPFEQLRKGYNNNKRPSTTEFTSPPAKKMNLTNIEDVKEFAEQQRMRKQIAAEYGDDPDYEPMLDDDIHNDDDDDDLGNVATGSSSVASIKQAIQQQEQQQDEGTTITFRSDQPDKPPTIIVKDSLNSKMNHAKIISEVLRQYPHLVKCNKNIKLKIIPSSTGNTSKIVIKKEPDEPAQQSSPEKAKVVAPPHVVKPALQKPPIQKTVQPAVGTAAAAANTNVSPDRRRIDSKTMHALIALGAENTTGPWLCLRCGVNGRPISIPSYRGFRRHLTNTHKEAIDPALCEYCGWRSRNRRELHFHMQVEHKIKTTFFVFPECRLCTEMFLDTEQLSQHMADNHPNANKQQCIYCNKIFGKELHLYTHIKTYHKEQALEDGIIDYSDEEYLDQEHLEEKPKEAAKVKILSDIALPSASTLMKLEPSSEADALSTVATGIATSIGITNAEEYLHGDVVAATQVDEPKFVNADGNEMILTDEQRKEILAQLNQQQEGSGVVMVLNDAAFATEEQAMNEEMLDNNAEQAETSVGEEEFDDSQIYNELNAEAAEDAKAESKKSTTATVNESKETNEHLKWAENLISEQDTADENAEASTEPKVSKNDDISRKLKELTSDWTDDENDLEEEALADTEAQVEEKPDENIEQKVTDEEINEHETQDVVPAEELPAGQEVEENLEITEEEVVKADTSFEDDIELAMKSLHDENDEDYDAVESGETEKVEAGKREVTAPKTKIVEEAVNDEPKVDRHNVEEAVVVAEDKVIEENAEKIANVKNEDKSENDTSLEGKKLLEELITGENTVENIKEETEEFINETQSAKADVDGETAAMMKLAEKENCKETEANTAEAKQATDDADEPMDVNEEDADEAATSSKVVEDDKDTPAKTTVAAEEKIKSLISEWADDDEEDDEE